MLRRERFGRHFPVMALVGVAGLVEEGALVEIETIAALGQTEAPVGDGGAPTRRPVSAASAQPSQPPAEPGGALAVRAWVRVLAVQKRSLAAIRDDLEREMRPCRASTSRPTLVRRPTGRRWSRSRASMLVTAGTAITGLVDRAARDGLVERRADPGDRRAWRVHLTAKGQRAFRDAERRHAAKVAKLFAGLSRSELETLIHLASTSCAAPLRPGLTRLLRRPQGRLPSQGRGASPPRPADPHEEEDLLMTLAPRLVRALISGGVAAITLNRPERLNRARRSRCLRRAGSFTFRLPRARPPRRARS